MKYACDRNRRITQSGNNKRAGMFCSGSGGGSGWCALSARAGRLVNRTEKGKESTTSATQQQQRECKQLGNARCHSSGRVGQELMAHLGSDALELAKQTTHTSLKSCGPHTQFESPAIGLNLCRPFYLFCYLFYTIYCLATCRIINMTSAATTYRLDQTTTKTATQKKKAN